LGAEKKQTKQNNVTPGKAEKIGVLFDVVAERILCEFEIFTLQDSKQVYIYSNGVYKSEGSDVILDKQVRVAHNEVYLEYWNQINQTRDIGHMPKATMRYVAEVIAHIKAFTYIPGESIEENQKKYLNFKNKLFNLDTWKLESHTPKIKTICQIPVDYNEEAECPRIFKFLKDVVAKLDINLLCELAGYCLTPYCSYQKAFMLYGMGSNIIQNH